MDGHPGRISGIAPATRGSRCGNVRTGQETCFCSSGTSNSGTFNAATCQVALTSRLNCGVAYEGGYRTAARRLRRNAPCWRHPTCSPRAIPARQHHVSMALAPTAALERPRRATSRDALCERYASCRYADRIRIGHRRVGAFREALRMRLRGSPYVAALPHVTQNFHEVSISDPHAGQRRVRRFSPQ